MSENTCRIRDGKTKKNEGMRDCGMLREINHWIYYVHNNDKQARRRKFSSIYKNKISPVYYLIRFLLYIYIY